MGRVDLSMEYSPGTTEQTRDNGFRANHFLMFLKVDASPEVSFMGEMLNQSFYHINYKALDLMTLKFGKILVPFGNTDFYHRYYGGIMAYGQRAVLFPILWAEFGVNTEWKLGKYTIDLYTVNGIGAASPNSDPSFTADSDRKRQAVGLRVSTDLGPKTRFMVSGYNGYWSPGRNLHIVGVDFSSDYGLFVPPVLKNLRFAAGVAAGFVRDVPAGNFRRYGDFVQIMTNALPFAEYRVRYGTYINDSRVISDKNTQTLSLGAYIPINVLNLLAEYQFNYEEINEKDNDLIRFMLALDF